MLLLLTVVAGGGGDGGTGAVAVAVALAFGVALVVLSPLLCFLFTMISDIYRGKKNMLRFGLGGAHYCVPKSSASTPNLKQVARKALRDCTNTTTTNTNKHNSSSGRLRAGESSAEGVAPTCGGADKSTGFFAPNFVRGCSWSYGWEAVESFLRENGFRGILRAHSVQVQYERGWPRLLR